MKIGILTDTHYGIRNDAPIFYEYFKKSIEHFIQTCKEQKVRTVFHLGDLYDRRKYVNFVTAKRCREDLLSRLNAEFDEVYILSGNHDEYYKNTHVVNSLDELIGDRYPNIRIITTPQEIHDILLVPWITESTYSRTMKAIKETKSLVAMGHFEFQGFLEQKGVISQHGLEPSLFDKFAAVYSGHFHHKHKQKNIEYIGAFAEYTWSDYNDPRGFSIFDTHTMELEFHRNPFTMFHMIMYEDVLDKNILETIKTMDADKYGNSFVRVVVASKTNPYAFGLLLEKLEKAQPYDISVVEDVSAYVENDELSEIDETEDTPTMFNKYIDGLTLGLDNDRIKGTMLSLYQEAMTLETI